MPRINTGRQAIEKISSLPPGFFLATIIHIDRLAIDANKTVLTASPIVDVNVHGIGGIQRAELPTGTSARDLSEGDELLLVNSQGRYLAVAGYSSSNRTAAGFGGLGIGGATNFLSYAPAPTGRIAGSQLELYWEPVPDADYYEIWASPTGDMTIDDAALVATSPMNAWVSKREGALFDDGNYYAVAARKTDGRAGTMSAWIQPTFAGNYANGLLSSNQTTVIPGSLMVTLAGSITRADFTSVDPGFYTPVTFTVDVCDPLGSHPSAWANGDILRFTDTSGNVLWVEIVSSTDMASYWQYEVEKKDPTGATNYTIPSGSAVANWGQANQGVFIVSADGTFGVGTLWQIITHDGEPWLGGAHITVQVYADSSGQLLAANGDIILNSDGIFVLDQGKLTIGTLTTDANSSIYIYVEGGSTAASVKIEDVSDTHTGGVGTYRARASLAATQANDSLGGYSGRGHTGSAYVADPQASLDFFAEENTTPSAQGSYAAMTTTPIGSTVAREVFRWTAGGAYYGSMDEMDYAATIPLDVNLGNLHKTTTVHATGDATINASSAGAAGQPLWVEIVNDATSGKTVTFGTNFKTTGTIVGTVSQTAMIHFISDGISFNEVSRTLGLV